MQQSYHEDTGKGKGKSVKGGKEAMKESRLVLSVGGFGF